MSAIKYFFQLLIQNKSKLLLMLVSAIMFFLFVFPLGDLTDLISTQVAKVTENRIFVQFKDLGIGLLPSPNAQLTQVSLDTPHFPTLKAQEVQISPSVTGLLKGTPLGSVSVKGLFRGDVDVSLHPGSKSEMGVERTQMQVRAQKMSLQEIREIARLPILLKGRMNLDTSGLFDATFQEQPDLDILLNVQEFELPPNTVQTPLGPLALPDLKLSSLEIKGKLSGGQIKIEQGRLGNEGDELSGTITGNLTLMIQNQNGNFVPHLGAYTFDLQLHLKKSFQEKAKTLLSLLDQYQTPTAEGAKYSFRLSATNPQLPPSMSALR